MKFLSLITLFAVFPSQAFAKPIPAEDLFSKCTQTLTEKKYTPLKGPYPLKELQATSDSSQGCPSYLLLKPFSTTHSFLSLWNTFLEKKNSSAANRVCVYNRSIHGGLQQFIQCELKY